MISFVVVLVFLQHSWRCLFGTKRVCVHHESTKLQEVFLTKKMEFSQGNHELGSPDSNIDDFFGETHVVLHHIWKALVGATDHFSTLKHPSFCKSSRKLTQFTWGNNTLDVCVSIIHTYLSWDTIASSTYLSRSKWTIESQFSPRNT
jgi:hypothetical protein